jgi:hypothetical protein
MAATNFTPISLYYSTTAATAPVAGNLVNGELAINITDGKLYYKNNAGVVTLLASTSGASGDVVGPASATDNALARFDLTTGKLIQNSVGILSDAGILTGLTGLTSSGSITFSSLTSGRVTYAGASGLLSDSANLTFSGSILAVTGTQTITNSSGSTLTLDRTSNPGSLQLNFNGTQTGQVQALSGGGLVFYQGSSPTEAMRITSAGLVGIGTSSPIYTLDVNGDAKVTNAVRYYVGSTQYGVSFANAGAFGFEAYQGTYIYWGTGSGASATERMRITSAGNVGIGTSSPGAPLDILSTTSNPSVIVRTGTSDCIVSFKNTGAGGREYWIDSGGTGAGVGAGNLAFYDATASATRMVISSAGNVGIGTSSPVAKLQVKGSGTSGQVSASFILENSSSGTGGMDITGAAGASRWRFLYGGGPSTGTNALTEAMCIGTEGTSAGLVGIGTSFPSQKLNVVGGVVFQNTTLEFGNVTTSANQYVLQYMASGNGYYSYMGVNGSGAGVIDISGLSDNAVYYGARSNVPLQFLTNNTVRTTITSAGLVGIGTSSPSSPLTISTSGVDRTVQINSTDGAGGYGAVLSLNNTGTGGREYYISSTSNADGGVGGGKLKFYDVTTNTTRMLIDSSGNVGIGVTPSAWGSNYKALQIGAQTCLYNAVNYVTSLNTNAYEDSVGALRRIAAGEATRYVQAGGAHQWFSAANGSAGAVATFTQAMTLDASGRLLVGTTTAVGILTVDGLDTYYGGYFTQPSSSSVPVAVHNRGTSSNNVFVSFGTEASFTERGSITYNRAGGLTVYNTTSDYRAKDITGLVTNSGEVIDSVPVYMGKMKDATQERPMFIAHETPVYAHTGEKDAVDKDGNPVYQQMDASTLIPVMWAEIQSLRQRIATLESK